MVPDIEDEDLMRRYLLDLVTAEEREHVEDWSESDENSERLEAIEYELIVQHLQGRLPEKWQPAFQSAFLDDPSGLEQVRQVAQMRRLLSNAANAATPALAPTAQPRSRGMLVAAAAIICVAVAGTLLYLNRPSSPQPAAAGSNGATPSRVVTLSLIPGVSRSELQASNVFRLSTDAQSVVLTLTAESPSATDVTLTLKPVGGADLSIASTPIVRRDGSRLHIEWPLTRAQLAAGDYLLTVSAVTSTGVRDTIASRFFTIVE